MDVCLINNHLQDFSFVSFSATLQLGLHDCHNRQQHKKMMEQTENVAYSTIISLTMKRQGKPKFYSYSSIQLSCSLAIMLAMATKVTQISPMFQLHLASTKSHNSCSDIIAL